MEHRLLVFELAFFHLMLGCSSKVEQQPFVGTKITFVCDPGYQREWKTNGVYDCVNNSGVLKWTGNLKCKKKVGTGSTTSDQNQKLEQKQHNLTDICGPLPYIPNASLNNSIPVGQELPYMDKTSGPNMTKKYTTKAGNTNENNPSKENTSLRSSTTSEASSTQTIRVVAGGMLVVVAFILLVSVVA